MHTLRKSEQILASMLFEAIPALQVSPVACSTYF
jgi:hypothetical protein